jgi:putative glutamine amidotransferase
VIVPAAPLAAPITALSGVALFQFVFEVPFHQFVAGRPFVQLPLPSCAAATAVFVSHVNVAADARNPVSKTKPTPAQNMVIVFMIETLADALAKNVTVTYTADRTASRSLTCFPNHWKKPPSKISNLWKNALHILPTNGNTRTGAGDVGSMEILRVICRTSDYFLVLAPFFSGAAKTSLASCAFCCNLATMKTWLMTYPEDKPSIEYYARFATRFDADAQPLSANDPRPPDIDGFAGLLLSGGGDVDPASYGDETRHPKTYGVSSARDEMEFDLIGRFIEAGKPIVGICRGLQMLAVYFGGRLHQHVPDIVEDSFERHRAPKGYECFHAVLFDGATRLGHAMRGVDDANSAHHQAIDPRTPPQQLRIAAQSPSGIIEAAECFEHAAPIIAVQWHPERLVPDHPASQVLAEFIRGALENPGG